MGGLKHTPNDNLELSTNISKVEITGGKLSGPNKVTLPSGDTNMIPQDKDNQSDSLSWMDLEYGKVVDEWKVHDDTGVMSFTPEKVCT